MANEITLSARLSASKSSTSVANSTTSFNVDMDGDQMYHANPSIGAAAALSVTPVSQAGTDMSNRYWLFIRNQDSTNEVHVSFDGGTIYSLVIPAGKAMGPILIRHGRSLYAKAIVPGTYPTESTTAGTAVCEVLAVES